MAELSRDTAHTIDVLEARLRRLQYVVYGNVLEESSSITNIFERLRELEHALNQLVFASKVRQDLVKLCNLTIPGGRIMLTPFQMLKIQIFPTPWPTMR